MNWVETVMSWQALPNSRKLGSHAETRSRGGKRYFCCKLLPVLLLTLALLPGCASLKNTYNSFFSSGKSAETAEGLVQQGLDEFNHGRYYQAKETFEKIKSGYPFSQYSLLAELKAADSQYFLSNYPEALLLYQEFEQRHPTNEAIPYIMFQIAMCDYKQIDSIDRDTAGAESAVGAFTRLLAAYPDSAYAEEAKARVKAARNFLANHEFYVATFYVRTKSYPEAQARLEYLGVTFPETSIAPQAAKLLADLKAGNPPKRSLSYWLPDLSLPDWHGFLSSMAPAATKPEKP